MVSVELLSLPKDYIDNSKELIKILEDQGFEIYYSYWYIKISDEDDEWYDGDWQLIIATDLSKKNTFDRYDTINNILRYKDDWRLDMLDIEVTDEKINVYHYNTHYHTWIKEYEK